MVPVIGTKELAVSSTRFGNGAIDLSKIHEAREQSFVQGEAKL
jgi:hypothetical protein